MNLNTEKSYNLISLSGAIGSGKDSCAKIIQAMIALPEAPLYYISEGIEKYPELSYSQIFLGGTEWEIKKFAGKLKEVVCLLIGCKIEQLESQEFKNSYNGDFDMKVREILQRVGTEAMRDGFHKDVWVKGLFSNYNSKAKWIVTDTRLPNEFKACKEEGALMLKIVRDSAETNQHLTETALKGFEFDEIIENNGSLEELCEKVKIILEKYNFLQKA